jgi:inner membrane protein
VDPIAHTLTGAALAAAGLRRATPLATAALVIGANVPDVDVVAQFGGEFAALAHRRGWSHGLPAVVVWPFVVGGLLLVWDRWIRRRRRDLAPARAGPLVAVAAAGVATHPLLDWLNNYGMRWLMPFDGRWFYGDAWFIVDPWVWLVLGGVLCLMHSRAWWSLVAWVALAILASRLILTQPLVPPFARAAWIAGIAAIIVARAAGFAAPRREREVECAVRAALAVVAAYMVISLAANLPARAEVRAALAAQGIGPIERVMVGPAPADPFAGHVVAVTADAYHVGRWHWLRDPRFEPSGRRIPRPSPADPIFAAAARAPDAQQFLTWSRFPYVIVQTGASATSPGYAVHFRDARYPGREGILGPTVVLDGALRPVNGIRP